MIYNFYLHLSVIFKVSVCLYFTPTDKIHSTYPHESEDIKSDLKILKLVSIESIPLYFTVTHHNIRNVGRSN